MRSHWMAKDEVMLWRISPPQKLQTSGSERETLRKKLNPMIKLSLCSVHLHLYARSFYGEWRRQTFPLKCGMMDFYSHGNKTFLFEKRKCSGSELLHWNHTNRKGKTNSVKLILIQSMFISVHIFLFDFESIKTTTSDMEKANWKIWQMCVHKP